MVVAAPCCGMLFFNKPRKAGACFVAKLGAVQLCVYVGNAGTLSWSACSCSSSDVIAVAFLSVKVSSSNASTISQPILTLSGDTQGQDLSGAGQTLQSVQLVNPGTFLIQAQTVTATGQIQWQTFQVAFVALSR